MIRKVYGYKIDCKFEDSFNYRCNICNRDVEPHSDDAGVLLCPFCEVTGLLIIDEETKEKLEDARAHARTLGLLSQLERQLDYLAAFNPERPRQCWFGRDLAPFSFDFCTWYLATADEPKRRMSMNGGLIYSGPGCPGNGSFPSLSVNVNDSNGWHINT